jgi:hypothetical protein
MGLYAQLLIRYLRVPTDVLFKSLGSAGIEADMQARPSFVDKGSDRLNNDRQTRVRAAEQ